MGWATRWLRSLLGGRKESREHKHTTSSVATGPHDRRDKRRWSFKSGRDSSCSAVPIPAPNRADDIAWLRALYAETETEQSKHAIAVAAATAAAADAAVAAAQAAVAVVRLTNHGRGIIFGSVHERLAAVKIQTAFRGYLAKKALRALKALVKLQALVRGYLVRKQAEATLHSMQSLIRAQETVRTQRSRALRRGSLERREETRSNHAPPFHSGRLSGNIENQSSGFDWSPKTVEIDTFYPKSKSSRRMSPSALDTSGDESFPCHFPGRIPIPEIDKCRCSSTAQSTPRYMSSGTAIAPPTPAKSPYGGDAIFRRLLNTIDCPSYMSSTSSFEAKLRSQSAPKQRPEPSGTRKRVPLSEVVIEQSRSSLSGVGRQKPSRWVHDALDFKRVVVGRLDKSLDLTTETEGNSLSQRRR
ncbi:hypothetical protein HPP92_008530 [Vanilla planifolia]|uniref:DUF4005 domain-containing protein n=1 Tax=Vanilla planifolia TaxID=51239 RepID=A0A835R355_VANPL|nr:hypothetical protein HPP92_008719 [Vanilla planifolia]KAG0486435.1 hypothetical protein HPP92_008530 [Vanilla planifolia]